MAKTYDICKLCGAKKFLNFIGLCKRCNQSPEAQKIIDTAVAARQERLAEEAADAAKEAAKAAEEAANEEETTEEVHASAPKEGGEETKEKKE